MERLTKRIDFGNGKGTVDISNEMCGKLLTHEAVVRALFERVAHYEDLEEQGLLITLPCKVGDTVWTLKYPEITKEDGSVWTVCDRKRQIVVPAKFTLFILKDIGVYYFLTKEEAEAKLKEFQSK